MLIQKSKGSCTFDKQKVKNIAIEYRLQLIFPNPGHYLSNFQNIRIGFSFYTAIK